MEYPYFFRSSTSAGAAFFLLAMLPTLSSGAEPDKAPGQMAMYFDDSLMVEVATRAPKPLHQVAENVSIITAEEIEAMHAHSVAEVLKYTAGLLVSFNGEDIGGPSTLHMHNSDYEQVTVLLDGMRWSFIDSDYNETNAIPVGIIDRIEVIKGAGSSTWGSALGGVVNIITKGTGKSILPSGTLTATQGERNTRTYNGDVAGKIKNLGYYFHAGSLHTDGLVNGEVDRSRDHETFFGKLAASDLPYNSTLTGTMGRFAPDAMSYVTHPYLLSEDDTFYTLALDGAPTKELSYHLGVQDFDRRFDQPGFPGWNSQRRDYSLTSITGHINWREGDNKVVVGSEHHRVYYQDYDPTFSPNRIYDEFWGVYVNDTFTWDKWSFTPGLRYDANLNADDMVSPSLGMTCRLSEQNLLRAGVSSGFRRPPPAILSYSPGLQPSKAWTTQVGLESTSVPYLKLKGTMFQHRERDAWSWDTSLGGYVNTANAVRRGFELEAETAKWQNLSLATNHTLTHTNYSDSIPGNANQNDTEQITNLIFKYDSPMLKGRLGGHYVWYDQRFKVDGNRLDTIIWDLSLTKPLTLSQLDYDLFFTAHNLFDGSQYTDPDFVNAGRWLEVGIVLHY